MKKLVLKIILIFLTIPCFSQMIISSNTIWTGDVFLSQKVVVNEGVTLKIEPGTKVKIAYIDTNGDNIGDVEIEVKGKLVVNGMKNCNPVLFEPYTKTNNRKYWQGIIINSNVLNDSIYGVNINNAQIPFNIFSNSKIKDCNIQFFDNNAINFTPTNSNVLLQLQSIIIKNGGTGINQSNSTSKLKAEYLEIDSCINAIIGNTGEIELKSSIILNSKRLGVSFNDGKLTILNSLIKKNYAFGVFNSSSDLTIKNSEIDSNFLGGVLISGLGKNVIQYSNIKNNKGAQIEISEYKFNLTSSGTITSQYDDIPTINVNYNNILGDTLSTIIDTARLFYLDYGVPGCGTDFGSVVCIGKRDSWKSFPTVLGRLNGVKLVVQAWGYGYSFPNKVRLTLKDNRLDFWSSNYVTHVNFSNWITTFPTYERDKYIKVEVQGDGSQSSGCSCSLSGNLGIRMNAYELRAEYIFGGDLIFNNIRTSISQKFDFTSNNYGQPILTNYFFDQSNQCINYSNYTINKIQNAGVQNIDRLMNFLNKNLVYLSSTNDSDTLCNSFKLTAPNISGATYSWYLNGNLFANSNINEYVPVVSGFWHSLINTGSCNIQTVARNIVLSNGPSLTISGTKTICVGESTTISVTGANSYFWNTNQTTSSLVLSPIKSTNYSVTGYKNGCATTENVNIVVNPLPNVTLSPYPSAVICKGSSLTLQAYGAKKYLWSNGSVDSVLTTSTPGVYSVQGTDINGCKNNSLNTTIIVDNNVPTIPQITILGNTNFCEGDSVVLTSSNTNSNLWSNGLTSQSITVKKSGIYYVSYNNGSCTVNSNAVTVDVKVKPKAPIINTSGNTVLCQGSNVTLTSSTGSSYLWSSGETTQSIVVSKSGSYSVKLTEANGCQNTSTLTTVIVNPLPDPSIISNGKVNYCQGETISVSLESSNGSSYLWSNGATTSSISPNQVGTYTVQVTDANGCKATSQPVVIKMNVLPSVVANATKTSVCLGENITLTGSGASTYVWDNNVSNGISFVSNATKTYIVTGTDANGCTKTASITVAVNSLPTVSATATKTAVCLGENVTLTGSGATTYAWDNNVSNGVSFVPSITKTYTVTGTDANGCSKSASINLVVNSPTVVANASKTTVCTGDNVILSGSGASTYAWDNNVSNGVSFIPSTTKTYTVTGTDANGCTKTATISVTVNSLPTVSATATKTAVCLGENITLTGSGASTYVWDNNVSNGVSFIPSTTKTYTVIGTDANGCTKTATISVAVNSLPTVSASATKTAVCLGENVILTGSGASTYTWDNNVANGVSFIPSTTKTYTVIGTDANGCKKTATISVAVNNLPNVIANASKAIVCIGDNVILSGSGASTYAWDNNVSNGVSFIPSTTKTYTVIGTDANGCTKTATISVAVNSLPTVSAAATKTSVCLGENVILTGSGASNYAWDNNVANGVSFVPSTTKTYTVIGTDANGCKKTATISVAVNSLPTVSASATKAAVCLGENVTLTGSGASTYVWDNNVSNGVSFVPSTTKTYTVTGTDANGCSKSASINIVVNSPNLVANASKTAVCSGENVTLTATGASSYVWDNNISNGVSFVPNATKTYTVTGTDANGCTKTASISVAVNSLPTVSATATKTALCLGENVTLTGIGASKYVWDNNVSNNVSFVPTTTKIYTVTGTDVSGCSNIASINLVVNSLPTVVIEANGNTTACKDAGLELSTTTKGSSYSWSNGETTANLYPTQSGVYSLKVKDVNGCEGVSNSIKVTVNQLPIVSVSLNGPVTFCSNKLTELVASNGVSYLWNDGSTTKTIKPTSSGSYYVKVTDINGCSSNSEPVYLTVNDCASLDKISDKNVLLYPNPITNILSIEVPAEYVNSSFKVLDVSGKELVKGSVNTIINTVNLESLVSGTYFLEIGKEYRTKFIKQ